MVNKKQSSGRKPDWKEEEFEILLENGEGSVADLLILLRGRNSDAISIVQSGIHSYHRGLNTSVLSQMMLRRLGDGTRPVKCPKCGASVTA